jgi:hypothetical protein
MRYERISSKDDKIHGKSEHRNRGRLTSMAVTIAGITACVLCVEWRVEL